MRLAEHLKQIVPAVAAAVLILGISGCGTPPADPRDVVLEQHRVANFVSSRVRGPNRSWATCLEMVFRTAGYDVTQEQIAASDFGKLDTRAVSNVQIRQILESGRIQVKNHSLTLSAAYVPGEISRASIRSLFRLPLKEVKSPVGNSISPPILKFSLTDSDHVGALFGYKETADGKMRLFVYDPIDGTVVLEHGRMPFWTATFAVTVIDTLQ
jgi:hypothetical protein